MFYPLFLAPSEYQNYLFIIFQSQKKKNFKLYQISQFGIITKIKILFPRYLQKLQGVSSTPTSPKGLRFAHFSKKKSGILGSAFTFYYLAQWILEMCVRKHKLESWPKMSGTVVSRYPLLQTSSLHRSVPIHPRIAPRTDSWHTLRPVHAGSPDGRSRMRYREDALGTGLA